MTADPLRPDPWLPPPMWFEEGWTFHGEVEYLAFHGVHRQAAERIANGYAAMRGVARRVMFTTQEMGRLAQ